MPDALTEYYENLQGSGGVLGGGGCFAAGTLIHTIKGLVPIEQIKVGQTVVCFDHQKRLHASTVTAVSEHHDFEIWRYHYWGGQFDATPNHHVLSEYGGFRPLSDWTIDDWFWDAKGEYRQFESSELMGRGTVYNFRVAKFHTYFIGEHGLAVSNGGGGKKKPQSPTESADTLRSSAKAQILELISEGEIVGLATGDAKSIYLDRTPVQNADGSYNFSGFYYDFRPGTQYQSVMPGVGDSSTSETQIGIVVKYNIPQTRTITNPNLDAIKVRIGIPALQEYKDNGDVTGQSVGFWISIKEGSAPWVLRLAKQIDGKASSLYEEEYLFPVNNQNGAVKIFQVKVERLTADATGQRIQNTMQWQTYTEVIFAKFTYPNSAIVGMTFNAEQFNAVPGRAYDIKGKIIKIPTNATVTADGGLNYSGVWNGTFYNAWCADPAWILYDLLTNSRYGAGAWIESGQLDKSSLYQISQYCNEYVPDGYGANERRFLCNAYIQGSSKAFDLINAIVSCFRGMVYWGDGTIYAVQDAPTGPTRLFTQADVVDGIFNYTGSALRSRHTIALVGWSDPSDFYRENIEVVTDQEGIALYGIRELKMSAFGCTSRGQAHRAGKWALFSERLEKDTVSFSCHGIGAFLRPGEVIAIADSHEMNIRYSGRIVANDPPNYLTVTLDGPVQIAPGYVYTLSVMGQDAKLYQVAVTSPPGTYTTLSVASAFGPAPEASWALSTADLQHTQWRVLTIGESQDGGYDVTALQYVAGKHQSIEFGLTLDPPRTRQTVPAVISKPQTPAASFLTISSQGLFTFTLVAVWGYAINGATRDLTVQSYLVEYQRGGGIWQDTQSTTALEARFDTLPEGSYIVRVASVAVDGRVSDWVVSAPVYLSNVNFNFSLSTLPTSLFLGVI
jgi:predicted phage tail protein